MAIWKSLTTPIPVTHVEMSAVKSSDVKFHSQLVKDDCHYGTYKVLYFHKSIAEPCD